MYEVTAYYTRSTLSLEHSSNARSPLASQLCRTCSATGAGIDELTAGFESDASAQFSYVHVCYCRAMQFDAPYFVKQPAPSQSWGLVRRLRLGSSREGWSAAGRWLLALKCALSEQPASRCITASALGPAGLMPGGRSSRGALPLRPLRSAGEAAWRKPPSRSDVFSGWPLRHSPTEQQ